MKKVLLTSVTLFIVCMAFAQDDDEVERPNGLRAGYQYGNLVKDGNKAADNLNGFYVGFVRQKKIAPLFKFETGLEYMMTGAKVSEDSKLVLHYIVLPVQVNLKLGPFIALAGINADFKVREKITSNGQNVAINDENKATFMDCAADLGAGLRFWVLTAEARYYWGLVNIKDGWHNRYAQFGLKLNF